MPVVEFQNHVVLLFNVFSASTSDNCSTYYCHSQRPKGTGACGEFQIHSSLIILLQIFSVFGSTRTISILPNGTGPF